MRRRLLTLLVVLMLGACSPATLQVAVTTTPQPIAPPATTVVDTATTLVPSPELRPPATVTPSVPATTATPVPPVATATTQATTAVPTNTVQPPAAPSATSTAAAPVASAATCAPATISGATPSDLTAEAAALPVSAADRFNQYDLRLDLDRAAATVTGTEVLTFTNRTTATLNDIAFHLYPNLPDFDGELQIGCAVVNGVAVEPEYEQDRWLMLLALPEPLAPNAQTRIELGFTTRTPRDAGETSYGAFNREDELWAMASFYPLLALWTADGWDRLAPNGWGDFANSDMALYRVEVTTNPDDGSLLTTGVQRGTCDAPRCTIVIGAGPQRDFTLVQVQGWEQLRTTVGETTVVSSFPADQAEVGQQALDLTADSLAKYNARFGAYPYTELDILPIPARGFAGVEYPGLIMIGERYYAEPELAALGLEDVVVHEVAHQWWYNVVGNDVLREPWLDEGITSYSAEYLYTELTGREPRRLTENRRAALEEQGLNTTPIDLPVDQYPTARAYVGVIYGRAPLFLDALRTEIGDDAFGTLLQAHYRNNQFGTATTAGFQREAETAAGRSLATFFAQWFDQ